jgi:formylglycine-generating enzyme
MRNTIGMDLEEIPAGTMHMGQAEGGDGDETPVHEVRIAAPFRMGVTPVTNAQYEQFDPEHRARRGERGLSTDDAEAVLFVSWRDAMRFCLWLSRLEGCAYRLPTEAEWEYSCRAGSQALYSTGDDLPQEYHRHQEGDWHPKAVPLHVGTTRANAFGMRDMHGLVEEWCHDWYAPYVCCPQVDPIGPATGVSKVTRGGSHNTEVGFLRSASRSGALPDERSWLVGFRVAQAELPQTPPRPPATRPAVMSGVAQRTHTWTAAAETAAPIFSVPIPFVLPPERDSGTPFYPHNHCPSITWCPNGDLLAAWFSTVSEVGRELTILASRLRSGRTEWEPASEFFKVPDRNMTGTALFHGGDGLIIHTNGLEASGHWANLALVVRTSVDNGSTWSAPWCGNPNHQPRNQVISGMSQTPQGWLIQPCDAVYGGNGGTAIHISRDRGMTWEDPGALTPAPDFQLDTSGATIAGIHAGVVALHDGTLLAFGRGDNRVGEDASIGPRMPVSRSTDMGRTWHYGVSPWPPIAGGQRLVLMRLRQGPLLFVSFTDASTVDAPGGMRFGEAGQQHTGYGAFAALSYDEGLTWPTRRLLSDGSPRHMEGGGWTGSFQLDAHHAEPRGYMAATQTPDGVIHVLSSRLHYRFNMAWLQQPLGS